MFGGKDRSLSKRGSPTQASLKNIRLGWKCLPGANALAYYERSYILAAQSFVTLGRGFSNEPLISFPHLGASCSAFFG
jgi:hypothetical protein